MIHKLIIIFIIKYNLYLKVNNAAFRFAERVKEYENLEECIRPLAGIIYKVSFDT